MIGGDEERALLTRLLRESVLKLCLKTMASHRRLSVDGIVLISLDDNDDDICDGDCDSGSSVAPIVIQIHEQLPQNRKRRKMDVASLLHRVTEGAVARPHTVVSDNGATVVSMLPSTVIESCHAADRACLSKNHPAKDETQKTEIESVQRRSVVPMDRKQLLRRAMQDNLASGSDVACGASQSICNQSKSGLVDSGVHASQNVSSHNHHSRPQCSSKLPKVNEEKEEEDSGRRSVLDGHWSDPTPELSRKRKRSSALRCRVSSNDCTPSSSLSQFKARCLSSFSALHSAVNCEGKRVGSTTINKDSCDRSSCCPSANRSVADPSSGLSRVESADVSAVPVRSSSSGRPVSEFHSRSSSSRRRLSAKRRSSYGMHSSALRALVNRQVASASLPQRLQCRVCPVEVPDTLSLERHNLQQHGLFTCHVCLTTCPDRALLSAHISASHNAVLKCGECGDVFDRESDLQSHRQWHLRVRHVLSASSNQDRMNMLRRAEADSTSAIIASQFRSRAVEPSGPAAQLQAEDLSMKTRRSISSDKDESAKPQDQQDEEESRGLHQSWCSECHIGFPSETVLMEHITSTHETLARRTPSLDRASSQTVEKGVSGRSEDRAKDETLQGRQSKASEQNQAMMDVAEGDGAEHEEKGDGERSAVGEKHGDGDEETLQGLSARSCRALRHDDVSTCPEDARCPSSGRPSSPAPSRALSPLRRVPLHLEREEVSSPAPRSRSHESLMTLTKPRDFVINPFTSQHSAARFAPSIANEDLRWTYVHNGPSRSKRVENFLDVDRSSPSPPVLRRVSPYSGVKDEPGEDYYMYGDYSSRPRFARDCHLPDLDCLVPPFPREGQDVPAEGRSPDLPTDLSLRRSCSASPRSAVSEGGSSTSSSRKSPSFDKVVTPDVLFRNQKPMCCGQPECSGEQFSTFEDLEEHSSKLHRKFLCQYCGKSFTAKPNRDRHVRYHTGVKPYKCPLCPQAFHRGDDLKYHRTTKHTREPFDA